MSVGFLFGFQMYGQSFGLHVTLAGTLQLDEVPPAEAGEANPNLMSLLPAGANRDMCHTSSPFALVMAYLRRARDNIARTNRMSEEMSTKVSSIVERWKHEGSFNYRSLKSPFSG